MGEEFSTSFSAILFFFLCSRKIAKPIAVKKSIATDSQTKDMEGLLSGLLRRIDERT